MDTVFPYLTGHDVQHSTHRVRAVKHASRASQHLDPLGHQRLIAVRDRMPIDALILRMSIDKHHQLACSTRDTTQVDTTSCTRRNAIAHHRAGGDKQSGHFTHHRRQYTRLVLSRQHVASDYRHRHRQVAHISSVPGAGHYYFLQSQRVCQINSRAKLAYP